MDFPEWAPQNLVDYYLKKREIREKYKSVKPSFYQQREENILFNLITKTEMKRVWKELYKRRKEYPIDLKYPRSHGDGVMALYLFGAIEHAIFEMGREITTRNDDVLKFQEIAKSARVLAEKISQSRLDLPLFEWLPIEAINTMLVKDINPDKAAGFFSLVKDESEFHRKGGIYEEVRYTDKKSGKIVSEYWRTMANNTKEFFNRFIITPQRPCISQTLKSLAEEADKQADYQAKRTRLANKFTTSKKTIFIRSLYPFMLEHFGSPLRGTLASLCTVVLDEKIVEEDVKNALKGYKISI